jgi:hypothetical protein
VSGNVGPDSASDNYAVAIQRKVRRKWRKVMVVRTRGDKDAAVVTVRRGNYRAVLVASTVGPALTSKTVRSSAEQLLQVRALQLPATRSL